ncbi:S-layer homology domain-containing protein [Paenibacillus glycanilyticus]|uniref:S-layer homology domain-containing protein n=1 Tax=Paenibacillus glycanilyticus TaxID=126569 RepID=UPI00203EF6BC|nr:S-layer homology domain-containing protein [Paenibacillus glycanilyticus]MCM3628090.1 S-layer homology domain-containing protein [Paenibacillus glycanilyticus]
MKKLLSLVLSLALLITLLPPFSTPHKASAAGTYFLFNNEMYTVLDARMTTDKLVTLTGTINNVVGNSISYSVYNIKRNDASETPVKSIENQTANIRLSGNNITVSNLELYPGLNKITFKGIYGTSTVTESIYIEYRDNPLLYDLTANIRGVQYSILEDATTVLQSPMSEGKDSEDISISGVAPNATKVVVVMNGKSYEYRVSDSGDYKFIASPLNIKAGKNIVTIRVSNDNQTIETTRELAFYNGSVTFYDVNLTDGTSTVDLAQGPDLSIDTTSTGDLTVTGKAIVPVQQVSDIADITSRFIFAPDAQFTTTPTITVSRTTPDAGTYKPTDKFITVEFSANLGPIKSFTPEKNYSFNLKGYNVVKKQTEQSDTMTFKLHNSTKPYIYDVNYLNGYTSDMSTKGPQLQSLVGTDIENANIFALPMGVEVLIGNYSSLTSPYTGIMSLASSSGVKLTDGFQQLGFEQVVYRNVNGVSRPFLRVFMEISKLPAAGTQDLYFMLQNDKDGIKHATVKLLYGPFAKYDSIYDGLIIKYDTTLGDDAGEAYLLGQLGKFAGQFSNIANESEIVFSNEATPTKPQTVFFYLNNVAIGLAKNSSPSAFKIDSDDEELAFNILNKTGENTIRIVYTTAKNNYENTIKFNIVPTNLPLIPAPNTDGVYPYSMSRTAPLANDPNFTKVSSFFSTKEAQMKVYGTFAFIDLGERPDLIQNKVDALSGSRFNYILQISSPNFKSDIEWDLSKEFTVVSNGAGTIVNQSGPGKDTKIPNLDVFYNVDGKYFYFILDKQEIPDDGSSQIYLLTVFNSGKTGPRATYRLQVDPIAIPYTVLSPVLEERNLNQNYVDVIITSPGAETMTINKLAAKKVNYLDYSDDPVNPTPIEAFKVRVTGIKENKETAIPIVITRGKDKITDTLKVNYQPANIPGAQYTETMASSHKAFNGSLALTFPKNTKLIRPSYNSTSGNSSQIYSGNQLLFGIANPTDGIVNRYEYRKQPADFWLENQTGSYIMGKYFSERFIKVSPLFWIDGGQADDNSTPVYDPITSGLDPYPYQMVQGDPDKQFFLRRNNNKEVIPSQVGSLTLSYDPSISQGSGTVVTVFRYDPVEDLWENIGGTVDEKKHTIKVPFSKFGYYVVSKLTYGYNDINDHPYAREAMEAIFSKGIMNAFDPTGIFGADQYVTRGEFARMIVRALNIPLNYAGTQHFSDVLVDTNINPKALYDYRFIETAARAGIVRGTQPKSFQPESSLTRQDATVILAKALNLKLETNASKAKAALDKAFKDSGNADYYAIPSILAIQKKGFIQGSMIDPKDKKAGYVFEPRARLLRSDAAIIMAKVMASNKTLPAIYAN